MSRYSNFLFLFLLVAGCQSTRPSTIVPATQAYGRQASAQQSEPVTSTQPVLLAALPKQAAWNGAEDAYTQPLTSVSAGPPRLLPPDTVVKKSGPPVLTGKPDPVTTIVNSVGGVTTAAGLGLMIAIASTDAPGTEWGGLRHLLGFLGGLVVLSIGLALLFFQGKNGRRRRLREARRIEAAPATPPVAGQYPEPLPASAKPASRTSGSVKTGRVLLVTGALLGVLGLTVLPILLLLAPVLLLLGAIFAITGN